jgi:hypothetical protein
MEVHHHSHTARKKWAHYFWEFLMLFLAVFCGFLAEYQLEHKIEKEKSKQYIHSFYADLITDTAEFSKPIARFAGAIEALKNRRECYDSLNAKISSGECLLNLFYYSSGFTDLIQADQTLLQLKSAGGFRLLNKEDADSIMLYDKQVRIYIKLETTAFQQRQNEIRQVFSSLFNYEWNGHVIKNYKIPIIFSDNRELLNRYFNLLDGYYYNSIVHLEYLRQLKQKAAVLIEYFKDKYHFN